MKKRKHPISRYIWILIFFLCFSIWLNITVLPSSTIIDVTTQDFNALSPSRSNTNVSSAVTFVFIIGLEGVGHHFISDLLKNSPNMRTLQELGLCDIDNPVAYGNPLLKGTASSPESVFKKFVKGMRELNQIFENRVQEQKAGSPFHIAINANGCHTRMLSYPSDKEKNRLLNSPNIDLFYNACQEAQVNCKHIYVYRDPYDVIASNTLKRKFNVNAREAVRTYTIMSQYIYSQLSYHSNKTLLCFGPFDVNGFKRETDWDRFGLIFGWKSADDFRTYVNSINHKRDISPHSKSEKLKIASKHLTPYMDAYREVHDRVIDLCYSSL